MAKRGGALTGLIGLIGLLALAAWVFKDRIPGLMPARAPVEGISRAAADVAQEKLQRLQEEGDTVHLTDAEFTSLIRYHLPGLAGPLLEPSIDFVDNTFFLNGRFPQDQIPSSPEFDRALQMLPDTVDLVLQGELRSLSPGKAALKVNAATVESLPLARPIILRALAGFGDRNQSGLAEDEYPFALPNGVKTARVEAGELVLGS